MPFHRQRSLILVRPLLSAYDIYDGEPAGEKAINIRDLAVVLNSWLEEKLWPE
jgi:hypothetical protein